MGQVPTFSVFFEPVIQALTLLGGSGSIEEIDSKTISLMNLSDAVVDEPHVRRRGTASEQITARSEVEYRLAWARTYLKRAGFLTNSARSVWALTEKASQGPLPQPAEIIALARAADPSSISSVADAVDEEGIEEEAREDGITTWQDALMARLLQMDPKAFERLAQRMLREMGFIEVMVTGRTGDGGIDGRGIARLQNIVSLHAIFQCKRYSGSVDAQDIRGFRGAMTGRSDFGIFLTTGRFTRGALDEAKRDGAPSIDLIDGKRLIGVLKDLRLGVTVTPRTVEDVEVDDAFFASI